jgi:hypothetical protein
MRNNFSDLIHYFRTIASQHVDIGHSISEKHFYRFELEEVLTGLKKVNYPALILEGYRYSLTDKQSDHVMKERSGAFMLLGHLNDISDYDAMHELWDKLEMICDDIIVRIKSDKRNPVAKAVRDFDLGSVNVVLIANENDKNYGVRCTFTISSPLSIDVNPENWNSNTSVPHS